MDRPSLLLVDDSPDIAQLVRLLGRRAAHEVRLAVNLPAARAALAEARPDLVLLDVNLPGESGLVLAREAGHLRLAVFCQGRLAPALAEALLAGLDFAVYKDLLSSPEEWARRIDEVLRTPNWEEWRTRATLPLLNDAHKVIRTLQWSPLRLLDEEVLRALVWRALARISPEPARVPASRSWPLAALWKQAEIWLPKPGRPADFLLSALYQAECLAGARATESLRQFLVEREG
jgi:CheY-like chemotaxis protein